MRIIKLLELAYRRAVHKDSLAAAILYRALKVAKNKYDIRIN